MSVPGKRKIRRVVIDTNVFVSSFFGGHPRRVIDMWKEGRIRLCLSGAIVEEYVAVLGRLGLADEEELRELTALFAREHHLLFAADTLRLDIVKEDPSDNKFFECAVDLQANYIISGDHSILKVKDYMGIKTVGPKEFMSELRGE